MSDDTPRSGVLVRRYEGFNFTEALNAYEREVEMMAGGGWFPVAQVWGWDELRPESLFVRWFAQKPVHGTLAVTYRRAQPGRQTSSE